MALPGNTTGNTSVGNGGNPFFREAPNVIGSGANVSSLFSNVAAATAAGADSLGINYAVGDPLLTLANGDTLKQVINGGHNDVWMRGFFDNSGLNYPSSVFTNNAPLTVSALDGNANIDYDGVTGVLTVPVTGLYLFQCATGLVSTTFATAPNNLVNSIFVNGTELGRVVPQLSLSNGDQRFLNPVTGGMTMLYLNAGDAVDVRTFHNAPATLPGAGYQFSFYLLGAF